MHTKARASLVGCCALVAEAAAQTQPAQDDINRNVQERAVMERGVGVRLDDRPPAPRPMAPEEVRRSVTLPTPGTEILRRQSPPSLPPGPRVTVPKPQVPSAQMLLDESQRRRQLELQSQLPATPVSSTSAEDVVRQQTQQTQQLQFQREQRAGQLGSDIMRNSDRAMGR